MKDDQILNSSFLINYFARSGIKDQMNEINDNINHKHFDDPKKLE